MNKGHNIKTIPPFRELLFDIRDGLSFQEFQQLMDDAKDKLPYWKWRNLPNGYVKQDRNKLFTALEEERELSQNNLTFLRSFLKKIKRKDLVKLVDELRGKTKVKHVHHPLPQYSELCDDVIDGLREDEFVKLKESCKSKLKEGDWDKLNCSRFVADPAAERKRLFVVLEENKSLGPKKLTFLINNLVELGRKDLAWKLKILEDTSNRFSVFNWRIIIPMVVFGAVIMATTFYQIIYPGPTSLHMWLCCYGAIHPLQEHTVAFEYTRNNERQHVRGVEFKWTTLKEKLHLDFEKHPADLRYYLNLDRCGHSHNMLFRTHQMREEEVFAVSRKCTAVYFHADGTWNQYESARNIMCPHNELRKDGKQRVPLKPVQPKPKHPKLYDDIIKVLQDNEHVQHEELSKKKERKGDWKAQNVQTVYTDLDAEINNLSLLFLIDKLNELIRTTGSLSVYEWKMLLVGVVLVITFYQVMFPGLTYFRMWCCCYGAIRPLRVIMFDFTTMDIQRPRVRGVEFEWDVLKAKLRLCFEKHTDPDMHYYLNMDRYGAGGVRHVRNAFFNLPQVRGPEVFAVNTECTAVYYHDNMWKQYRSATNITRSHNATREETANSSLLALLLDDKTEYYQE